MISGSASEWYKGGMWKIDDQMLLPVYLPVLPVHKFQVWKHNTPTFLTVVVQYAPYIGAAVGEIDSNSVHTQ